MSRFSFVSIYFKEFNPEQKQCTLSAAECFLIIIITTYTLGRIWIVFIIILFNWYRPPDYCPVNAQFSVFSGSNSPVDHLYLAINNFNPGKTTGPYTTACIKVWKVICFRKFRPVSMSADKHHFMFFYPPAINLLHFMSFI